MGWSDEAAARGPLLRARGLIAADECASDSRLVYRQPMESARPVTPGWRSVGMCAEGDVVDLGGLNPWEFKWDSESDRIVVAHPYYPQQRHDVYVWSVRGPDGPVRFAAGEMSAGAWAFFLPR